MTRPGSTYGWKDEDGVHPMRPDARNTIAKRTANDVLRVIRNALAHGNIIYLDENGQEQHGARLRYLAFLSRYEETDVQRAAGETYRLVTSTEDGFVVFVKAWASWLESLPPGDRLVLSQKLYESWAICHKIHYHTIGLPFNHMILLDYSPSLSGF